MVPQRILVAGCGTGAEAFDLARAFPQAEVVAVDFSSRSIRLAREQQSALLRNRPVRFLTADLCSPRFVQQVRGEFDLIICHGVLSYIPKPKEALRNLRHCLRDQGRLYLGVNGALHFSETLKPFLKKLGYDLSRPPRDARFRGVLKLWEALAARPDFSVPRMPDWYLQGDLFCPVMHNFPLTRWLHLARDAGLFFVMSFGIVRDLRRTLPGDHWRRLFPCSRQALCEMTDIVAPAAFHRLQLAAKRPKQPPWQDYGRLKSWRIQETGLYHAELPARRPAKGCLAVVTLRSRGFNSLCRWPMPAWETQVLKESYKGLSLGGIVKDLCKPVPRHELLRQLFLLWHLGVLNVLEPE